MYANLISQSVTNSLEAFKRYRDFVCKRNGSYDYSTTGIGWTLWDSSYATNETSVAFGDWFVIYSPGEDGKQDIYFKCTVTSGYLTFQGYQYWNNSTHAGVQRYGSTNLTSFTFAAATTSTIWIYGDLDFLCCIHKETTVYRMWSGGMMPDSSYNNAVAISSSSVSSGTNKNITLDTIPSGWATGVKVFIRDNANCERASITNISGNVVTVDSLTASYTANCKLQLEITYNSTTGGSWGSTSFLLDHTNTKDAILSPDPITGYPACNSDALSGKVPFVGWYFGISNQIFGPLKNVYKCDITNRVAEETLNNGSYTYRFFNINASMYVAIKEV